MAGEDLKTQIILEAQDRASAIIQNVANELGALSGGFARFARAGGPVGIALAGIATAAGGVVLIGSRLGETVKQLDLLSARTGVSSERLQVLQQQIAEAGGSAETLTGALTFLNRAIAQGDPLLGKLGIKGNDVFSAFMQLAGIFERSNNAARKTEVAYQLLGGRSAELVGILPQLARGFSEMDEKMRRTGAVIGEEVAGKARVLNKQLEDLRLKWKGTATDFQTLSVPVASAVLTAFDAILKGTIGAGAAIRKEFVEPIEELSKAAASLETFQEKIDKAKREAAKIGGFVQVGVPTVEGIEVSATRKRGPLDDPDLLAKANQAAEARANRLRELRRVMGQTREEAIATAAALDRISEVNLAADISKQIAFNQQIEITMKMLGLNREDAEGLYAALKAGADEAAGKERTLNQALAETAQLMNKSREEAIGLVLKTDEFGLDPQLEAPLRAFNEELKAASLLLNEPPEKMAEMVLRARELDDATARINLRERLGLDPAGTAAFNAEVKRLMDLFDEGEVKATEMARALKRLGEEAERADIRERLGITDDMSKQIDNALDRMLDFSNLATETMDQAFSALSSSFANFFAQVAAGTATLGGLLKAIWHGIANAIISELARIAAAYTLLGIAKIFGFFAGAPGFDRGPGVPVIPPGPAVLAPAVPPSSTTFNVYSYDLRDGVRELSSLGGSMRNARAKLAYLGEY